MMCTIWMTTEKKIEKSYKSRVLRFSIQLVSIEEEGDEKNIYINTNQAMVFFVGSILLLL